MKRLLLLGAGHAHLHVLKSLIDQPLTDTAVTLISPTAQLIYSGMLPGWFAGHYSIDDCTIPLLPLANKARAAFYQLGVAAVDLQRYVVRCADQREIAFDVLSIDEPLVTNLNSIPGARENAMAAWPTEAFIESVAKIREQVAARRMTRIVIIGAGILATEFAFAMRVALGSHVHITLISGGGKRACKLCERLSRQLKFQGVRELRNEVAARIAPGAVLLESANVVDADIVVDTNRTAAGQWSRLAGLAVDPRGFIAVNDFLQSRSHPYVFFAGQGTSMQNFADSNSNEYAAKPDAALSNNLRNYLCGEPLQTYRARMPSLHLVTTGEKYATASWGNVAIQGEWVWRWKNWLDRRFVAKYVVVGSGTNAARVKKVTKVG